MSPFSNESVVLRERVLRKNFSEKWQFEHKTPQGVLGKHFTSSLVLFAAFEKRVCANKESSSYTYIVSYIYIERSDWNDSGERKRERELERRASWHHFVLLLLRKSTLK